MLHQMVYVSSALRLFEPDELAALLRKSRANNARDGITGMLLYHGGTFMQAFEGPADATERLRLRIEADARHRDILELYHGPVEQRHFAEWTMGFRGGDEVIKAEPAFHTLVYPDAPDALKKALAGRARTLLMSFQRRM